MLPASNAVKAAPLAAMPMQQAFSGPGAWACLRLRNQCVFLTSCRSDLVAIGAACDFNNVSNYSKGLNVFAPKNVPVTLCIWVP